MGTRLGALAVKLSSEKVSKEETTTVNPIGYGNNALA